ncbi:hypothetical protein PVAP13_1KG260905 [Panicum virgatum]|uniref:Uncharacterized protein n=1 Tax=Panicum virgatum TaxID=38727 RepID=A0A8T0XFN7_PANVG|nr:hypothetical protein PVAP13_1KG260905 [Panicum virgatum]
MERGRQGRKLSTTIMERGRQGMAIPTAKTDGDLEYGRASGFGQLRDRVFFSFETNCVTELRPPDATTFARCYCFAHSRSPRAPRAPSALLLEPLQRRGHERRACSLHVRRFYLDARQFIQR